MFGQSGAERWWDSFMNMIRTSSDFDYLSPEVRERAASTPLSVVPKEVIDKLNKHETVLPYVNNDGSIGFMVGDDNAPEATF